MTNQNLRSEKYGNSTFLIEDERIVGSMTILKDCVGIHGRYGKFTTLPIDIWNAIVDQYESARS